MVDSNLVHSALREILTAALKEAIKPLPGLNVTWRLTTTQQMLSQGVGGIFPPQETFQWTAWFQMDSCNSLQN